MGFSSYIAVRFLRHRRSGFISLITVIAVLGVAIGVTVLNVTLGIMNGFRDEVQLTFVENMPMVTVLDRNPGGHSFESLESVVSRVLDVGGVEGASPFIRNPVVLTLERISGRPRHATAVAWGIDPQAQETVTPLRKNIEPPFDGFDTSDLLGGGPDLPGIVLGGELGANLHAGIGDVVMITAPQNAAARLEDVVSVAREFMVVGFLQSGMFEFDNTFLYLDLAEAQDFFNRGAGADGIGVRVTDMMQAPAMAAKIEDSLGSPPYFATDWINLNDQLFRWIQMEKVLMFLLLLLITVVAAFSMAAILTMMVRDRQRDIGILMSLGVSRKSMSSVFIQLGLMIGCVGVVLGTVTGYVACLGIDRVGIPLPGDIYFVDNVPVHVKVIDLTIVAAAALFMSFLATLLPSWLASRFTPVEVLRYE